jgi:hypothetical protein
MLFRFRLLEFTAKHCGGALADGPGSGEFVAFNGLWLQIYN